jgi:acyl-coenzyme A thioesterase PaaI-like protein
MAPDPTALFTLLADGRVQATELARGPWDPRALHGGPVAALVARALETTLSEAGSDGDPAFLPARLTLELERPVGLEPLVVTSALTRPGRSVRTAEVEVRDDAGRRLARATLVAIRERAERLDLSTAALPADQPPPMGPPA